MFSSKLVVEKTTNNSSHVHVTICSFGRQDAMYNLLKPNHSVLAWLETRNSAENHSGFQALKFLAPA